MEYFPFVTTAGRMSKFKKAMRVIDANEVRYEHVTQRRCSFCAATGEDPLRQCSVCKSVRYCDEKCQLEDYRVRHKRECGRFVTPPLTRAFLTQSTGNGTIYPKHPVFAKGYHDGVGCWVSHEGRPDFGLQAFATNIWATPETWRKTYSSRVTSYTPLAEEYNALRPNLLTLAVVVQNRRKDKKPIVVFAGRTRVVTKPGADHDVTRAKSDLEDITSYEEEGGSVAALRVAEDPLYRCPRLAIKNVAGVEFKADHPPLTVVNEPHGIVFLAPGEYVVYNVQFRVGDGNKCSTDVDALIHLRALSFVWQLAEDYVPWVQERAEHIRSNPRECPAPKDVGPPPPETLIPFDLPIVFAYYLDAIKEGERKYVEGHYGKKHTEAIMKQNEQDRWVYAVAAQMQGITDERLAGDIEVSDVDGQTVLAAGTTGTDADAAADISDSDSSDSSDYADERAAGGTEVTDVDGQTGQDADADAPATDADDADDVPDSDSSDSSDYESD